jgi:ribonuclease BN (tRNA processing enzyme)
VPRLSKADESLVVLTHAEKALMRVEFLGTGGYHPNETRHTTCVMLPELGVVFDAGTGFFRVPERVCTPDLHIFLSHAHLDHIVGLTYVLSSLSIGEFKRAHLYGTEATLTAVREHLFAQPIFPVMPAYEFHPLTPRVAIPEGGVLTHMSLSHPGGSTGFRIDWPQRSLAFITDTTVDGTYTEFVRGVNLLIHECYLPDERAEWAKVIGHSSTTPVAQLAREAEAGQLVLIHVDPQLTETDPIGLEQARGIFPRTELAEDLMVVEF